MVIAKIIVDRTAIHIAWKHKIPKGIIGGKVQIEYADDVWNELHKTAVFQGCTTKDIIDIGTEVVIPPEVVAEAMKEVVQEFRHYFKVIEFAVYCSPRDEQNYLAFKKVLGELE
mgnify:CR=1 FL=1